MNVVTARNLMSKKVVYVEKETPFPEVVKLMQKSNISCVLVGRYGTGIITERDLVHKAMPQCMTEDVRAKHIMTKPVVSVKPGDSINDVVKIMEKNKVRHLVVKDAKGVRGIITQTDVVHHSKKVVEITLSYDYISKIQLFIIIIMAIVVLAIALRS